MGKREREGKGEGRGRIYCLGELKILATALPLSSSLYVQLRCQRLRYWAQTYRGHDIHLLTSHDAIDHVTIRFAIMSFPIDGSLEPNLYL